MNLSLSYYRKYSCRFTFLSVIKMARIETYVFLDLETTGLPREELNKTKITELSMVAVKRRHLLETTSGALPRVLNKFTICINPGRMISPQATQASGLDNDLLEYDTKFNMHVFNCINSFLECQLKPVCLVAENGYSFDFPILKNHFEKLNVSLNDEIMCADSLYAFYDILKPPVDETVEPEPSETSVALSSTGSEIEDKNINLEVEVIESDTDEETKIKRRKETLQNGKEVNGSTLNTMQLQNENTPKSQKIKATPAKKLREVKRKLFYDGDKKPNHSNKLKNIYERVLGRHAIEAHRAENDCVMTAEVATAKAQHFVKWIDENHSAFAEVQAMTLGVPL